MMISTPFVDWLLSVTLFIRSKLENSASNLKKISNKSHQYFDHRSTTSNSWQTFNHSSTRMAIVTTLSWNTQT